MPSDPFLARRHAVVTGGSRGIGAAIAHELARHGAAVTVMGRDAARLDTVCGELRATYGTRAGAQQCDVTDEAAVQEAFAAARAALGEPYVLVNNAGQAEGSPFLDTTRALWERMLTVNLTSAFLCTQQVLRAMLGAGEGRIVNVASMSGLKGYRNVTAYTASKHGLVGFTRALAAETVRGGVTVNAVCPAYVETAMTERAVATVARDLKRTPEEARSLITRTIPRGTLIQPREVASVVVWLCSPDASGTTGQAIAVAGGEQ